MEVEFILEGRVIMLPLYLGDSRERLGEEAATGFCSVLFQL